MASSASTSAARSRDQAIANFNGDQDLPPHLEEQPRLVHGFCVGCAKALADQKNDLSVVCDGGNVCQRCRHAKTTCVTIPPRFRRCTNVLHHLRIRATARTHDDTPERIVICRNYARLWVKAYDAFVRRQRGLEKKHGSEAYQEYLRQQREELAMNWQRYKNGAGGIGECVAANEVLDEKLESAVLATLKSTPTRRSTSTPYSTVTTIFVGLEQTKFIIHRHLLIEKSAYFQGAFYGDWDEARKGEMNLQWVIPYVFQVFAHWLYFQAIEFEDDKAWFRMLSNAWLLGHNLRAPGFQNAIIDTLISRVKDTGDVTDVETINTIYNKTIPGSPLRRLLVDLFAWQSDPDDEGHLACLSSEVDRVFLSDLAETSMRGWKEGKACNWENAPFCINPEGYHTLVKGKARRDVSLGNDAA